MRSEAPGNSTLTAEVTNISRHGLWILLADKELFLPFSQFPWFRESPVKAITNLVWLQPYHLYWPDLDVDLTVEAIEHPEQFPLVAKLSSGLEPNTVDLQTRGIDQKLAVELRARLATFAEDWDSPEMDVYDRYDEARSHL